MLRSSQNRAFTLIELLVAISIIAVLIGLLVPAVSLARDAARRVTCMSQQRQIGIAIQSYAQDYQGIIPYGPIAPPMMMTNFYLYTGHVTNLISLQSGQPVGVGLLLEKYLSRKPEVVFCPANDQPLVTSQEIAAVGVRQVQSSYFYRHASVVTFSHPPDRRFIRIAQLGTNRDGQPIRALLMDGNLLAPTQFGNFGISTRTNHNQQYVNVLYAEGHVQTLANDNAKLTVDLAAGSTEAPSRILAALEYADTQ